MRILAGTDFSTRSNRAIRQAGLLLRSEGDELHIVHVVDDDQPDELVRLEKAEAERLLREQARSMPELQGKQVHALVEPGDPFDGILRVAAGIQPDLIVMGTHRKQLLRDILTGTTIERVVRRGSFPVLMVNFEAQRVYKRVVAGIDMSEASAKALKVALHTGLIGDGGATLLHAFMPLTRGPMFVAGSEKSSIESHVADERRQATDELASFLIDNDLHEGNWSLRVEEGAPMEVISRAVTDMRPDLLVLGTQGRSAIVKALMGSVAEQALRSLNVDILAVPASKRPAA
jgi:nucleotide-binding universal stress UspA family protein